MTTARTSRTYPLSFTGSSINTSIVSAFDWACETGGSGDNGVDHSGNSRNWTAPGSTASVVTTAVGKGRDPSVGRTTGSNYYGIAGASSLGLPTGGGAFTIWKRIRTPSIRLADNVPYSIGRIGDSENAYKLSFGLYDVSSTSGFHWYITGASTLLNWSDGPALAAGTVTDLHIVYSGGSVKVFVDGVLKKTSTETINFLATNGGVSYFGNASSSVLDTVFIDDIYWGRALSDAEVAAHQADPYSFYTASGGGTNASDPGGTGTSTGSGTGGTATGGSGTNASDPGGTGTSTGSGTGGTATGGGSGTFTFDACENNTHSGVLNSVSVNWAWHSGGNVGAGTTITNGSGTMTTSGMTVSGLPAGVGYGVIRSTDGTVVAYQEGTVS